MRPLYQIHEDALPCSAVRPLKEHLLASGLLGQSQLAGGFLGSRGFGVALRAEATPRLLERFSFLAPFISVLELGQPMRHLRPFRQLRVRVPNAYYLNLLFLEGDVGVSRHVDGTLQEPTGVSGLTPEVVSALYLQVPQDGTGGELQLYGGRAQLAAIKPMPGALVHFRGDLAHAVAPLVAANAPRVSLVCEQYALAPRVLERLAPLTVQTRAPDPVFAPPPGPRDSAGTFASRWRRRRGRER